LKGWPLLRFSTGWRPGCALVEVEERAGSEAGAEDHGTRRQLALHWPLVISAFVVILSALGLGRLGYPAILPYMRQGLNLSNTEMGAIATGNLSGYLLTSVAAGYLTIRYRARSIMLFSLMVLAASLALTGLANTFAGALLLQTLVGAGSAGCVVTALGLVSSSLPQWARGRVTGLVVGGAGVGQIVAGWLMLALQVPAHAIGWRYGWFALGAAVLLTAIVPYTLFRSTDRPAAADEANPKPIAWSDIYRNSLVLVLAFISVFFALSFAGYNTFFVEFLISDARLSGEAANWHWQLVGIAGAFSGPCWGWLSDVWNRKASLFLVFLSLALAIILGVYGGSTAFILSALLFGFTMWSSLVIIVAIYGDQLSPRLTSAALGINILIFGFGQIAGVTIVGHIADVSGSFVPAFTIAAGVALLGLVLTLFLKQPHQS